MTTFYATDQPNIGDVMHHLDDKGISLIMCIMLCGRTTPDQRDIVQRGAEMNREEYMDILNYFIKK